MGALSLPSEGMIYLDSNGFIYSVEKIEPYVDLLYPVWLSARTGNILVQSSELALLEVLVKPFKLTDRLLEASFRDLLLGSREVLLLPIDQSILERAAELRATTGLKTPDAIHAAAALDSGCSMFVTNDPAFRRVPGLPVVVLSEVAATP